MPIYQYKCAACQSEQEAIQKFSDVPLVKCEKCGEEKLEKQMTVPARPIFKGTGFYATDYPKKKS